MMLEEIRRLKIKAGYIVKVFFCQKVDEYDSLGDFCPHAKEIQIKKDQCLEDKLDTFTHEIIHALDDAYDIQLSERQTEKLGTSLNDLFRKNPDLKFVLFPINSRNQRL